MESSHPFTTAEVLQNEVQKHSPLPMFTLLVHGIFVDKAHNESKVAYGFVYSYPMSDVLRGATVNMTGRMPTLPDFNFQLEDGTHVNGVDLSTVLAAALNYDSVLYMILNMKDSWWLYRDAFILRLKDISKQFMYPKRFALGVFKYATDLIEDCHKRHFYSLAGRFGIGYNFSMVAAQLNQPTDLLDVFDPTSVLDMVEQMNSSYITGEDIAYIRSLREISDPYVLGSGNHLRFTLWMNEKFPALAEATLAMADDIISVDEEALALSLIESFTDSIHDTYLHAVEEDGKRFAASGNPSVPYTTGGLDEFLASLYRPSSSSETRDKQPSKCDNCPMSEIEGGCQLMDLEKDDDDDDSPPQEDLGDHKANKW
jgi:hypothetical protein